MSKVKQFFEKYATLKTGVKAALWFTVCNLLQKGIAMITMPIFTRLLTTEQYGVLTIYNSWYSVISIIVTLILAGGIINSGRTKSPERRNEFISAMQGLSTVVTIVFFAVYLCAHNFFNNLFDLSTLFVLTMFLQLLFEPAYLFWAQRQRYEYRYKSLVAVTLFTAAASPICAVLAILHTEYKVEARIISFALVNACVGLIFYIIQLYRGKKLFVKDFWKFALAFNLPLVPHYLSQIVLGQSDRIMIEKLTGLSDAALYGVAYNIAATVTIFVNAINNSFVPSLYQNMKKGSYGDIRKTADMLCLFMAAVISIFMLLGPEGIAILAAPEYSAAKWVFPPVAASVFFVYIYALFINIEFYFEKTQYVMLVSVAAALLNIGLNYIFIQKYGYIAAAYTTVFCYILFSVGHYLLYKMITKRKGINEAVFDGKRILIYSLGVCGATALSLLLYNHTLIRYGVIAVIGVLALINIKKLTELFKKVFTKEKESN